MTLTKSMALVAAMMAFVKLSLAIPHHGGLHAEHRMMPGPHIEERQAQQHGSGWPDSHSLWADIPTSQSFHSQIFHKWEPAKAKSVSSQSFFVEDDHEEDAIHSKRHALPSPQFFAQDHAEFERPSFGSSPSTFSLPTAKEFHQPPTRPQHRQFQPHLSGFPTGLKSPLDYKVHYDDGLARPKRQPSFPQGPPGASISPPTSFDPFPQSVDFRQEPKRPLRHITSYPSAFHGQQDSFLPESKNDEQFTTPDFDNDFEFKSPFGGRNGGISGGKSHSYTTFEAPKLTSNVFIDHSSNDAENFNRPSRSPPPLPRPPQQRFHEAADEQPSRYNFSPSPPPSRSYENFKSSSSRQPPSTSSEYDSEPPFRTQYDTFIGLDEEKPRRQHQEKFRGRGGYNNISYRQKPEKNNEEDMSEEENTSSNEEDYNIPTEYKFKPDFEPHEPERYNYRGRGQIDDENYDRVNKEENGNYEVRNYREPVRNLKYEHEEPVDVQHYGNDYGHVETFKGGYDSDDDAEKGIDRFREYRKDFQVEDEPVEDYNRDGYYVPNERSSNNQEGVVYYDEDESENKNDGRSYHHEDEDEEEDEGFRYRQREYMEDDNSSQHRPRQEPEWS